MTTEADRLSKIEDHCQQRLAELHDDRQLLVEESTQGGRVTNEIMRVVRQQQRREISTILNLIRGISIVLAVLFAGCALDADPSEPDAGIPTCASLGAAPDMPLFCNAAGYCVYEGQRCARGSGDGSGAGSGSAGSAGSAASGGTP